jgi:Ser/Thr protein kinase RdoA (MazF antagonist)
MLGRVEAALVDRERDLPGLGLVLDDEAFGERLAELLPDQAVRSAHAVYMRYKPRTSCLVSYRVLCRDGEVDVHALARASGAREKLEKARARAQRHSPPRLFVLEDRAVLVAVFPEDGELRVLARLAEPDARRELLGRLLGCHPGPDGRLVRVRYKPERRWVGRLELGGGSAVALKAYASPGFEPALRGIRAPVDRPPLRTARLLGALPERRLIALEWIEGRVLSEALLDGQAGPPEVALAGEALACVHCQPASGLPVGTPAGQARRVLAAATAVGFVQPELSARAEHLAREVCDRLVTQVSAVAPTHGDFHAGQVLLADGAVALIDFDGAVLAPPAADLASFMAHLEWLACKGRLSSARAEALGHALLEGYQRRAAPPPKSELTPNRAAALLRIAPHFFRDRDPEWPERTEAVLDRIASLLRGGAAPVPQPGGVERLA